MHLVETLSKTVVETKNQRRQGYFDRKERLLDVSYRLFQRYGFEDTTLESIAEEAGLHVQTLYRHFPKKNDLIGALLERHLVDFKTFMAAREENALIAWRNWVKINAERTSQSTDRTPPPIPKFDSFLHGYEAALANEIAKDMRVDPQVDLKPILMACMLVGTNKHRANDLAATGRTQNWVEDLLKVVDEAIATFGDAWHINTATKEKNAVLNRLIRSFRSVTKRSS